MKVRTIINIRNDLFDDEINEFIQHKHVIDIKFTSVQTELLPEPKKVEDK